MDKVPTELTPNDLERLRNQFFRLAHDSNCIRNPQYPNVDKMITAFGTASEHLKREDGHIRAMQTMQNGLPSIKNGLEELKTKIDATSPKNDARHARYERLIETANAIIERLNV